MQEGQLLVKNFYRLARTIYNNCLFGIPEVMKKPQTDCCIRRKRQFEERKLCPKAKTVFSQKYIKKEGNFQ